MGMYSALRVLGGYSISENKFRVRKFPMSKESMSKELSVKIKHLKFHSFNGGYVWCGGIQGYCRIFENFLFYSYKNVI